MRRLHYLLRSPIARVSTGTFTALGALWLGSAILNGFGILSQTIFLSVGSLVSVLAAGYGVSLAVIFQPELRRAFVKPKKGHFFLSRTRQKETIEAVTKAVFEMATLRTGALIAFAPGTAISHISNTGIQIRGLVRAETLRSIFFPNAPLHDGGVVIRNHQIVAASCTFPLSGRRDLDPKIGTRHLAAIGITEEGNAVAVVVSEESGTVSICHRGKLEDISSPAEFEERLLHLLSLKHDQSIKAVTRRASRRPQLPLRLAVSALSIVKRPAQLARSPRVKELIRRRK